MKKIVVLLLMSLTFPVLSADTILDKRLDSAQDLVELFKASNYQLDNVRKSKVAPRMFVTQIPYGLREMEVHIKTSTFIKIMLPNVIKANAEIAQERETLLDLNSKVKDGMALTADEKTWLKQIEKHYNTEPDDWISLLARVDTIPPSLAITQAIEESGWGTSHFAIEGNALFGEHLPAHSHGKFIEASGAKVKMAAFDTVLQATEAYMHNLNTSHAYRHLREKRSAMRNKDAGHTVDGYELANELKHYSEIGMKYVTLLHNIMHHYHLNELDSVHLDDTDKVQYIKFR